MERSIFSPVEVERGRMEVLEQVAQIILDVGIMEIM
jgi:hypothetical protein